MVNGRELADGGLTPLCGDKEGCEGGVVTGR